MNAGKFFIRWARGIVAVAAFLAPLTANATLHMNTFVTNIAQVGFTADVKLGHVVDAQTNFNRLTAGGSFTANCVSPYTGVISDERILSSGNFFGNSMTVTIPEWVPATRTMPGFVNVPGGTTLACMYNWKATAEEGMYSVSASGLGITVGGEKLVKGTGVPFEMYQPGGDAEISHGCLP